MGVGVKAKGSSRPHSYPGGVGELQVPRVGHSAMRFCSYRKGRDLVLLSAGAWSARAPASSLEAGEFTLPAVPLVGKAWGC